MRAAALQARSMLVGHLPGSRVSDDLRITVGVRADLRRLMAALAEVVGAAGG